MVWLFRAGEEIILKNHLIKLLAFILVFLFVYFSPFKLIVVSGNSMFPTLKNKQILIGVETSRINKNDVVVAYNEGGFIIKRVKFLEGDTYYYLLNFDSELPILIDKNDYNHFVKHSKFEIALKSTVQKNNVFLLGDNTNNSDDSRRFGTLEKSSIKYKIIYPRL
jgi:signal peptidase I